MGELKDLRQQQENLVARARDLSNKLYLAGLGAITRLESTSSELLDSALEKGKTAFGEAGETKPKALLVSRGALEEARALAEAAPQKSRKLYQQALEAGREDSNNDFLAFGYGAIKTARAEGEKLFNELVTAGQQRS